MRSKVLLVLLVTVAAGLCTPASAQQKPVQTDSQQSWEAAHKPGMENHGEGHGVPSPMPPPQTSADIHEDHHRMPPTESQIEEMSTEAVAPPSITSLNPTSGLTGSVLTITGANFGDTQKSSTVNFSGFPGMVKSWSATSVAAYVPAGNKTHSVVVMVNGVASNSLVFTMAIPPLAINGCPAIVPQRYYTCRLVEGGTEPYNGTVTAGSIPPGLQFDPNSGYVYGWLQNAAISAPIGLHATKPVKNSVTVSWVQSQAPVCTPACPIRGNNVYRGTQAGKEDPTPYMSYVTPQTSFQDVLSAGKTYFYKVTAVNAAGESPKSAEISVIAPPAPKAPTGLALTAK